MMGGRGGKFGMSRYTDVNQGTVGDSLVKQSSGEEREGTYTTALARVRDRLKVRASRRVPVR